MSTRIARLCASTLVLALVGFATVDEDEPAAKARVAKATPFLMFQDGNAEEAMRFYAELFRDGRVLSVERYGEDMPGGPEGTVYKGAVEFGGQVVRCHDSPIKHAFEFTPSFSLFVDCPNEAEIERLAAALGEDGEVLMPLGDYGFSKRFTWVVDRFGISWQLNLPADFDDPY